MASRPKRSRARGAKPASRPAEPLGEEGVPVRLNKLLADNGIASRRKADEMIAAGQVMVDGEIVTELGTKVDPRAQRIEVDGVVLRAGGERHRYYLLNKPAGVLCTNEPREARPRAIDLITDRKKGRIFCVGRLDEETVGLVLLTNDGEFANRVGHPRYGIPRTYRVQVGGRIDEATVAKLKKGVRLSDFTARFQRVRVVSRGERRSVLELTLGEGRNREIRRALAKLDLPVRALRRVAIGRLRDRGLKVGHWRPLVRAEVESLLADSTRTETEAPSRSRARARSRTRKPDGAGPRRRG
jgi:23S rRNA pseudouridine2605 synthase